MTRSVPDLPSFAAMLRAALGDRIAPDADGFLEMMHPDAEMEFPYAPPGTPRTLHGHAALTAHVRRLSSIIAIDGFSPARVHPTSDDTTTILQFTCTGRGLKTGHSYDQTYISVITTRDGRITHYVDYWNPLIALRAAGGEAALTAAMSAEVPHA